MSDWPTPEKPGRALIGPTGYGSFGIVWRDFPAMERRGGYSGPYTDRAAAEQSAQHWAEFWDLPAGALKIEQVANVNKLDDDEEANR